MAMLIDWHAHHTAPELVAQLGALGGRAPRPDAHDGPDFARRIAAMDAAGVDVQLVWQGHDAARIHGGGLNPEAPSPAQALQFLRQANDLIAERVAPYPDRLCAVASIGYTDGDSAVAEIERMAGRGARGVMLPARPDLVGCPETEQIFAKAAALDLPLFLHGVGARAPTDSAFRRLEDGGEGVAVTVLADAAVAEFVVRMIAAGVFDRYPRLQIVVRSGGGSLPILLGKLWWKHRGPDGEARYSDLFRQHFLVDTANCDARTIGYLIDVMGEDRVLFGSDYCGGLGPLDKAVAVIDAQPEPGRVRALTERNARRLLHL
jgi:predicted TIM-barrel fold metal-dependent hydrolase